MLCSSNEGERIVGFCHKAIRNWDIDPSSALVSASAPSDLGVLGLFYLKSMDGVTNHWRRLYAGTQASCAGRSDSHSVAGLNLG